MIPNLTPINHYPKLKIFFRIKQNKLTPDESQVI